MTQRWVCFDIGETLVDETRVWSTWADVLGLPRFTLLAVIGGLIALNRNHEDAFELLGVPDAVKRESEVQARYGGFRHDDLYPDALRGLAAVRRAGHRVAVIGNQPARRQAELAALGVTADVMAMSESLGTAKPEPAFFVRTLALLGDPEPGSVAYVGDRVDNDVLPAAAAGLRTVWLRRGPWGLLQRDRDGRADLVVGSLDELAVRLGGLWDQESGARPAR